jgi:hypothetical protein
MNLWSDLKLTISKVNADGSISIIQTSDSPVDNVEHIYTHLDPNSVYEMAVSEVQLQIKRCCDLRRVLADKIIYNCNSYNANL